MSNEKPSTPQTAEPDPEMLKNLELLLSMDVVEDEPNWSAIESIEESEE